MAIEVLLATLVILSSTVNGHSSKSSFEVQNAEDIKQILIILQEHEKQISSLKKENGMLLNEVKKQQMESAIMKNRILELETSLRHKKSENKEDLIVEDGNGTNLQKLEKVNDRSSGVGLVKSLISGSSVERIRRVSQERTAVGFYTTMNPTHSSLGDNQVLIFTNVVTNVANGYDVQHGVFTAPVSGLYLFSVTLANDGAAAITHVDIVKNGTKVGVVWANLAWGQGSNAIILDLDVGDRVWLAHNLHESSVLSGGYYSSFLGVLVS